MSAVSRRGALGPRAGRPAVPAAGDDGAGRGDPGLQRGGPARRVGGAGAGAPGHDAVELPGDDRRQRQHRPDRADRPPAQPRHPEVQVVHLAEKGRGRALKRVWSASESDVLVYMDVDLSTDLAALLPLVAPLVSGHSDLAIGSRLSPALAGRARRQARADLAQLQPDPAPDPAGPVQRRPVRLQGGTTGRRARAAAARRGQRLVLRHRAARGRRARRAAHPRGAGRLGRRPGQQRRHRAHGARRPQGRGPAGPGAGQGHPAAARGRRAARAAPAREAQRGRLGMQLGHLPGHRRLLDAGLRAALPRAGHDRSRSLWANFIALLVTAVANTAANRRFTFGVRGPRDAVRHQVQGLVDLRRRPGRSRPARWPCCTPPAPPTAPSRSPC